MNIAFVIYGALDLVSGGFLYDRMLIAALRARGCGVEVFALPWRRGLSAFADNLGAWPPALRRRQFDVVIQDELIHPSVFLRNRHLTGPVVALVHNVASAAPSAGALAPLRRAAEARYLRAVDAAIAVCRGTLRDVERLCGRPVRAVVAPPGRDHLAIDGDSAFVAGRAAEPGPLRLLMVATVMPHKGLHRLLAALAATPGWTLEVAGSLTADPRYASAVRAQAARAGLADRVRFHGELQGNELWACYRRSQVLVLPSDREAYPLACLEALGHGLAILVTNRGGTAEMITSGCEGWLLDPADPAAWSAAVATLAGDRPRLAAMAHAARARFAQHRSWSDSAAVVDDFLRSLAARGDHPFAHEHPQGR